MTEINRFASLRKPAFNVREFAYHLGCILVVAAVSVGFMGPASSAQTASPAAKTGVTEEIQALVQQLGDRSYRNRLQAQRRLLEIGPAAGPALRAVAEKERGEAAVRARQILTSLSHLLLTGVDVRLQGPEKPVAWNDPIPLTVVMTNRSAYPAYVPVFPKKSDPARRSDQTLRAARLIDLSDLLVVIGPDDEPQPLEVDDIRQIESLPEAVHARIDSQAVSTLAPGKSLRLTFPAVNRGWARYRFLDSGRYRMHLNYVPEWSDAALREDRVGVVTSNTITFRIDRPAPESIRRASRSVRAELVRRGGKLSFDLVSTHDVPVYVNTHVGRKLGRTAKLVWIVRQMDKAFDLPAPLDAEKNAPVVHDPKTLVELPPEKRVSVAQMSIAELLAHPTLASLQAEEAFTVEVRYVNQFSRAMITEGPEIVRKRAVPLGEEPGAFAATLPNRIVTGVVATDPIEITLPKN